MRKRISTHVTYANVMATIAVFMVLGGGAYAASKLPKNSVGTAQIKNKAVTKAKLAKGVAVAGPKGDKGDTGSQGPAGPKGDQGAKGDSGTNGTNAATTAVYRRGTPVSVAHGDTDTATATCNQGEKMIGGGGGWINIISEDIIGSDTLGYNGPATSGGNASADQATPDVWRVNGTNTNNQFAHRLVAYAICVSP